MEPEHRSAVWVDDSNAIFRRGLTACLMSSDLAVVGQSSALRPAPVLHQVDLLMFEALTTSIRQVRQLNQHRTTRLLALCHDPRDVVICELLEAGVAAVLPHAELTCETLLNTVRAVLTGVAVVPAESMPRLLEHARATGRQVPGALSDREREVLKWLAEGSDTREIASGLCFSERTVKNVVHDILMKLNCRTRAHAVALATRSGVI